MRRRTATGLVVALSFTVATVGCFRLSGRFAPVITHASTMSTYFEADIPNVYRNMAARGSDHYRTKVHPIFSITAYVPTKVLREVFGLGTPEAVRVTMALSAGLWAAALALLLGLLLPRLVDTMVFTSLGIVSAAALTFFTVPERYGLGSLSIVIALVVAALSERVTVPERWIVATSALTLAFTVTNWMVGLIATFTALPRRRAVQASINAFFVVTAIWAIQKLLLFPSAVFFVGDREELRYVLVDAAGGPLAVLRSMFFHSMVMPAISTLDILRRPDWPPMTIQHSALGSAGLAGGIATALWGALLAVGVVTLLRKGPLRRVRLVAGGSLAGQALLHLLYGEETFLYSLHYLPLLVVAAALGTRTRLRPAVLAAAALLLPLLAVSNARQLRGARDYYVTHGSPRHLVTSQMRLRPEDPWPRGEGHTLLAFPDSAGEDKAYHEPGGSFSPAVGSFGVSLWVLDQDGSLRTTSDTIPLGDLQQSIVPGAEGLPPGVRTRTPFYDATWSIDANRRRVLRLRDKTGPDAQLALMVRSVGPAGDAVERLRWAGGALRIGDRWTFEVNATPARVEMGSELDPGWLRGGDGATRADEESGWAYFRFVLDKSGRGIVATIDDHGPSGRAGETPYPSSTLHVDVPDATFLGSLDAQVGQLLMGLVEGKTRPGDPTNYPLTWLRDSAHVVTALARAGHLDRAIALTDELVQADFFGGFGAEADGPGAALWAIEEVAARANSPELDRRLWPHVERKAALILEMIEAEGPLHKAYAGPIVPAQLRRKDLTLVCDAARDGLIVGRMDNHWPQLYVNATAYRGLLDAASIAERVGSLGQCDRWRRAAANLKTAWERAFLELPDENPRTYAAALWPYEIGTGVELPMLARLAERWRTQRLVDGSFRQQPLWPYFDFAEAHQWLFVGRPERAWQTLDWFLDNQASPGLFTWGEGRGEENSFGLWERVRGWVEPPHVTPHYWAAAEALNLALDMLVYARPEAPAIVVGAGVPEEWLEDRIEVRGLPTRNGVVDWRWQNDRLHVSVLSLGRPPVEVGEAFRGREIDLRYESRAR